jgi:hypothetical protein
VSALVRGGGEVVPFLVTTLYRAAGTMGRVTEPGSRLIVPVPNLEVSRVWEVGRVRFHPAGSAAELVMAADAQLPVLAPPVWHDLITEKVKEFGQAAVAEVAADGPDQAMAQVASALAVLRAVQHMRNPMSDSSRQTFGLPGQVRSGRLEYFILADELSMGGGRVGALAGFAFGDDDHRAWATDLEYRYLDETLRQAEADRTVLQRRALVAIDLLSDAWLSWQDDIALLTTVIALEVLLGEERDQDKKFRVARRVSYFMCGWPSSDRYPVGNRPPCPLLTLPLNTRGKPQQELRKLIDAVENGQTNPCTEFFRVLDLFTARNRIVHGGRLGLEEGVQSRATWFISRWLLPQALRWFADHPSAELAELDAEIAALAARFSAT